ncbi:hypothetical protein CDAR_413901 [Caerostris darwini]|uniref:Uncharacterized protein n=1 Tax=Caerostris darwini TaxID=1538125 RepID=A0AAV4RF06_9ARAC|nr:hypothetical protein CDAR_413901 [Caerostris darwini]
MEFKVPGKRDSGKLWLHCVAHPMVLFVKRGVAKPAQSAISGQALWPICLGDNSALGQNFNSYSRRATSKQLPLVLNVHGTRNRNPAGNLTTRFLFPFVFTTALQYTFLKMALRVLELGLIIKLTVAVNREFQGKLLPRGGCLLFYHTHTPAPVINSRVCLSWSLKCLARGTLESYGCIVLPIRWYYLSSGGPSRFSQPFRVKRYGPFVWVIIALGEDVIFIAFRMAWNMSYRESWDRFPKKSTTESCQEGFLKIKGLLLLVLKSFLVFLIVTFKGKVN